MVTEIRADKRFTLDHEEGDGDWFEAVHGIHQRIITDMDLSAIEKLDAEQARQAVSVGARQLVTQMYPSLLGDDRERVIKRVIDEAIGYGPIQPLIDDDNISEVMINAPEEVFFERDGVIYLSPLRFRDNAHIMRIVERIIAPLGRRVDESVPYVDARLPDGSRVNVIIPPLVPRSPTMTIRKFRREKYKLPELIANSTMTEEVSGFLQACVRQRLNVLISGGTGTGKTTLLNALSFAIPNSERIISIEDPIEMKLQQTHVIAMEARPANIEGKNEVSQRDLVRNALRMRPDRIIIGEVRGSESFDMLQAMNTGHEGSLTTIHANSPRDALIRVENMVMMAGFDLPVRAIREQIAAALHLVLQISRFPDGRRRITHVTEITGREHDTITTQDIFVFQNEGIDADGRVLGEIVPTGIMPTFAEEFARGGAVLLLTLAIMRSRQATPADRRIRRLLAPETAPAPRGIAWDDVARGRGSRLPVFRDWLSNSEWAERTQTEIDQSGIRLRVGEYAIIRAVLAAVFFIVPAVLISAPAGIVMGLAGAAIGFYAPKIWLSTIRKRRIAAVAKQLPEAITMIANALRAGFAFQHGLDMVSKQMEPPISEEFTRVTVDLNVGSTVEEAMNALLVRSNSEDMNMMVTAILVQRTSGGNLAEILETVAETMRERERLVGEVRTLTSQQRFSGMVLSLWPLLLLGFFSLINWDQTSLLFTTGMGQILLMIMLLGNLLGYYTIKRILDVDI